MLNALKIEILNKPIKIDSITNLLLAWNNNDPVTGNNDWKYHGVNRTLISIKLLNQSDIDGK
jgi:hypothetical protein